MEKGNAKTRLWACPFVSSDGHIGLSKAEKDTKCWLHGWHRVWQGSCQGQLHRWMLFATNFHFVMTSIAYFQEKQMTGSAQCPDVRCLLYHVHMSNVYWSCVCIFVLSCVHIRTFFSTSFALRHCTEWAENKKMPASLYFLTLILHYFPWRQWPSALAGHCSNLCIVLKFF